MTTPYQIIKEVQETKGSKAKQAVLEQHKDNDLLREYLKAVYDPSINYYITKLPKDLTVGVEDMDEQEISAMIYMLSNRRVTGKNAESWLRSLLGSLNQESHALVEYIIKRDIKAGIAESTVLKVWPDLFFIPPYMRCASMDDKVKAKYDALRYFFVQTKMDGSFGYLQKTSEGACKAFSRAGSYYPTWVAEKLAVGVPNGFVLMGELLVVREEKLLDRKTGNGILNSLLSGDGGKFDEQTDELRYVAWDVVSEDEFDIAYSSKPYLERLTLAACISKSCPSVSMIENQPVYSVAEAFAINTQKIMEGEEGTVWKDPNGFWRDSTSGTSDAVKAKLKFQAEYRVVGKFEGEGKYAGMLGGFNFETSDGLIKFNAGSGLDDNQRKEYWEQDTDGWIFTIEANDVVTRKGSDTESLFLPIIIERRLDRTHADSRDRVLEQLKAAKEGVK